MNEYSISGSRLEPREDAPCKILVHHCWQWSFVLASIVPPCSVSWPLSCAAPWLRLWSLSQLVPRMKSSSLLLCTAITWTVIALVGADLRHTWHIPCKILVHQCWQWFLHWLLLLGVFHHPHANRDLLLNSDPTWLWLMDNAWVQSPRALFN